jgi:chaperonin cofactor prefoldin
MEREIEQLHALAREAKEAGKHDKAEAIFHEAEQLKRHLAEMTWPQEEREHKEGLEHQVEMLRDEVSRLREDIEKLENIIRQKVMNR